MFGKYIQSPFLKEFHTVLKDVFEDTFNVPVGPGTTKSIRCVGMVFEETIFFPEGGGQPSDQGNIKVEVLGSPPKSYTLQVFQVLHRSDLTIVHLIKNFPENLSLTELPKGTKAVQELDWPRRERHMKYHTGQHLLSSNALMIYKWETLNWQLTPDHCFVELNTPDISCEQIKRLERNISECIQQNLPVKSHLLKAGDKNPILEKASSRGLPENHGDLVRIVQIGNIDYNKCCGTHLSCLSQLQVLKIEHTEKGKTRNKSTLLYFVAGLEEVSNKYDIMFTRESSLSSVLGKNPTEHVKAVLEIKESLKKAQKKMKALEEEAVMFKIQVFKALQPMPKIFSLHRDDGDLDLLNFAARQFQLELESGSVNLFLTVGSGMGHLLFMGKCELVKQLAPKLSDCLSGKGRQLGNRFLAKVSLCNRNMALQLLTEAIEAEHRTN